MSNTQWYVDLDIPVPVAHTTNSSPIPPPRQRQNPFNRPENGTHHQRIHNFKTGELN